LYANATYRIFQISVPPLGEDILAISSCSWAFFLAFMKQQTAMMHVTMTQQGMVMQRMITRVPIPVEMPQASLVVHTPLKQQGVVPEHSLLAEQPVGVGVGVGVSGHFVRSEVHLPE